MEIDGVPGRLLELAGERGVSLSQLSRLIGRNSTYLQQFIRKRSPRKLEENDRRELARFFGVDEAQLGGAEDISLTIDRRGECVDLPRLAVMASAGPGAHSGDEQPTGSLRFFTRWLREQGLNPATLSAISVAGDSMAPTLRDGDEILVDSQPRGLRDGIHVVLVNGHVMVKRIDTARKPARQGWITLVSDNESYKPIEVDPRELKVIGKVVWKGGRL